MLHSFSLNLSLNLVQVAKCTCSEYLLHKSENLGSVVKLETHYDIVRVSRPAFSSLGTLQAKRETANLTTD